MPTHEQFINTFLRDPSQVPVGAKCRRLEVKLNNEGNKCIYKGGSNKTRYLKFQGHSFLASVDGYSNDSLKDQVRGKLRVEGPLSITDDYLHMDKMIIARVHINRDNDTEFTLRDIVYYVDSSRFSEESYFRSRCNRRVNGELTEVTLRNPALVRFLSTHTIVGGTDQGSWNAGIDSYYNSGFYSYEIEEFEDVRSKGTGSLRVLINDFPFYNEVVNCIESKLSSLEGISSSEPVETPVVSDFSCDDLNF